VNLEDLSSVTFHGIEEVNMLAVAATFGPYVLAGVSCLYENPWLF